MDFELNNGKSELLLLLATLAVVVAGCVFLLKEGSIISGDPDGGKKKNKKRYGGRWATQKQKFGADPPDTPADTPATADDGALDQRKKHQAAQKEAVKAVKEQKRTAKASSEKKRLEAKALRKAEVEQRLHSERMRALEKRGEKEARAAKHSSQERKKKKAAKTSGCGTTQSGGGDSANPKCNPANRAPKVPPVVRDVYTNETFIVWKCRPDGRCLPTAIVSVFFLFLSHFFRLTFFFSVFLSLRCILSSLSSLPLAFCLLREDAEAPHHASQ